MMTSDKPKISKILQTYLGQVYNPERHWTSSLFSRNGHKPFKDSFPCAAFTMRDRKTTDQIIAFLTKYGHSQTPNWKECLRVNPPVYHVDLAVSVGSKTSSFFITSSQVERVSIRFRLSLYTFANYKFRMRRFRMHYGTNKSNTDIVVLVRVSDKYSEDLSSIDLFIDPWRLFGSDGLTFEENWIVKGAIQESTSGSTRKRGTLYGPSVSWAMPAKPGIHQNDLTPLRGQRDRET